MDNNPIWFRKVQEYTQGEPQSWQWITGYGARLSAPGYTDCTDWSVFETLEEAREYLEEMYGDDDADADDEVAS